LSRIFAKLDAVNGNSNHLRTELTHNSEKTKFRAFFRSAKRFEALVSRLGDANIKKKEVKHAISIARKEQQNPIDAESSQVTEEPTSSQVVEMLTRQETEEVIYDNIEDFEFQYVDEDTVTEIVPAPDIIIELIEHSDEQIEVIMPPTIVNSGTKQISNECLMATMLDLATQTFPELGSVTSEDCRTSIEYAFVPYSAVLSLNKYSKGKQLSFEDLAEFNGHIIAIGNRHVQYIHKENLVDPEATSTARRGAKINELIGELKRLLPTGSGRLLMHDHFVSLALVDSRIRMFDSLKGQYLFFENYSSLRNFLMNRIEDEQLYMFNVVLPGSFILLEEEPEEAAIAQPSPPQQPAARAEKVFMKKCRRDQCKGKLFPSTTADEHKRFHETTLICWMCEATFETAKKRRIHEERSCMVLCPNCNELKPRANLKRHRLGCEKQANYYDPDMTKTYTTRKKMNADLHPGKFYCKHCEEAADNRFSSKGELEAHMEKFHKTSCHRCGKTFRTASGRNNHNCPTDAPFKSPTTFKCTNPGCTKAYTTKSNLLDHIHYAHEDLRRYQCPSCGQAYRHRSPFEKHTSKHVCGIVELEGEEPCASVFNCKHDLTEHQGTHIHKCSKCPKTFTSNHARNQHERVSCRGNVHQNLIICPLCNKSDNTRSDFKKHFRRKHKDHCSHCMNGPYLPEEMKAHNELMHPPGDDNVVATAQATVIRLVMEEATEASATARGNAIVMQRKFRYATSLLLCRDDQGDLKLDRNGSPLLRNNIPASFNGNIFISGDRYKDDVINEFHPSEKPIAGADNDIYLCGSSSAVKLVGGNLKDHFQMYSHRLRQEYKQSGGYNAKRPTLSMKSPTDTVNQPKKRKLDDTETSKCAGHAGPFANIMSCADHQDFCTSVNLFDQDKAQNSGLWCQAEINIRQEAKKHPWALISTGLIYKDKEGKTATYNNRDVPYSYYKVAFYTDENFKVDHIDCFFAINLRGQDVQRVTLAFIEKEAGVEFFNATTFGSLDPNITGLHRVARSCCFHESL